MLFIGTLMNRLYTPEELKATMLLEILGGAEQYIPPPWLLAAFAVMVLFEIVSDEEEQDMPPPVVAVFAAIVLSKIAGALSEGLGEKFQIVTPVKYMPPPLPPAEFPLMVLFEILAETMLGQNIPPPLPVVWFPVIRLFEMVGEPQLLQRTPMPFPVTVLFHIAGEPAWQITPKAEFPVMTLLQIVGEPEREPMPWPPFRIVKPSTLHIPHPAVETVTTMAVPPPSKTVGFNTQLRASRVDSAPPNPP